MDESLDDLRLSKDGLAESKGILSSLLKSSNASF
jgi:hypothetical protein